MSVLSSPASLQISLQDDCTTCHIQGAFSLHQLSTIESQLRALLSSSNTHSITVSLTELTAFDTAAALLLIQIQEGFESRDIVCQIDIEQEQYSGLFAQVLQSRSKETLRPTAQKKSFLECIGRNVASKADQINSFFAFSGELSFALLSYIQNVKNIRFKEILFEMNESAIKALGIIALTTFLIGIVIAYQSSVQLKVYGANIFIVDMLGISILRELAPLITAIVVAGRSGSAYAAQIGVMKLTEELDAMRTMGFDPYRFLVLPRIIALMIMMPILIFFADIMGVLGGIVVASIELDITPSMFIERFSSAVDIKHFYIGLFKGPFFAFLIGAIGIYRGLMVKNDTQSIGINTTKSVVEAIFAVIMCDALFSIIFTNLGY